MMARQKALKLLIHLGSSIVGLVTRVSRLSALIPTLSPTQIEEEFRFPLGGSPMERETSFVLSLPSYRDDGLKERKRTLSQGRGESDTKRQSRKLPKQVPWRVGKDIHEKNYDTHNYV